MAARPLPSQEVLRQLFRYEPETGKLFWRERPVESFGPTGSYSPERVAAAWNAKNAGKEAFTALTAGYRSGRLFGAATYAHRVIWKMMTGEDAEKIDHDNGQYTDNRWRNLKSVTQQMNLRNMRRSRRNSSGVTGVWVSPSGKYVAEIRNDGRKVSLGRFEQIEDAARARAAAELRFGYHPNHGRSP